VAFAPSTAQLDRAKKLRIYAESGVGHAWLVDPVLRTLEVLRRNDAGRWLAVETYAGAPSRGPSPSTRSKWTWGMLWEG
jgi:Uma2 family endonuclease